MTLFVKVAGSLFSLRGINAIGASGLLVGLAAEVVGGGDTGRVAERGNEVEGLVFVGGFEAATEDLGD